MATTRKRPALELDKEQVRWLQEIVLSKTEPRSAIVRARMLLRYARGDAVGTIAKRERVSRPTVQLCVEKALSGGICTAVRDLAHPGRPGAVSEQDKEWVMHLARSKPTEHGYQSATWTLAQLAAHVQKHAGSAGHPALERASKYIIRSILRDSAPMAHNVTFSRAVPGYRKTAASLLVLSKQIKFEPPGGRNETLRPRRPLAGESAVPAGQDGGVRPGSSALRLPSSGRGEAVTVRLLAGVDFSDGRVIALFQDTKKDNGFARFLEKVDGLYPPDWRIRIIPTSFSSAATRENIKALRHYPNRFECEQLSVDRPWISFADVFFTRMMTALLHSMPVKSEDQFVQQLNRRLDEINLFSVQPLNYRLSTA